MQNIVNSDCISNQLIDLYSSIFETIQLKVLIVNLDPDYFSLKLGHLGNNLYGEDCIRIETLLFGSLEMFSQILMNSNQFHQSNSYFLNLIPQHSNPKFFYIEVDFINSTNDVLFLEAYCYDENENMIAKGGTLTLKN